MQSKKVEINISRLAIADAVLEVCETKDEAKVILDNCCQKCTLILLNQAVAHGAHFTGTEITELVRNSLEGESCYVCGQTLHC